MMILMSDKKFMRIAIEVARRTDFPYGAIIVKNGKIIAKAGTVSKWGIDPTAHAEITAIRKACRKLNSRKLKGATIYTTCEPCPMCFAAAWLSKVNRIVYGMSLQDSSRLMGKELEVNCKYLNKKGGNIIKISKVLRNECVKLFD
jgi:tRNA(Arg) A34 adenosine deaminase TadA